MEDDFFEAIANVDAIGGGVGFVAKRLQKTRKRKDERLRWGGAVDDTVAILVDEGGIADFEFKGDVLVWGSVTGCSFAVKRGVPVKGLARMIGS